MTADGRNSPVILRQGSTVSRIDRENVNIGSQITPIIQRFYSLFVWDLSAGEVIIDPTVDPSGKRQAVEYYFETPPKTAEMTEPFTTRVVATQNGGKFIESHGSIFKDIRLSGTTGLRPRKGAPESIPLLNTGAFEGLATAFSGEGFGNQIRKIPENEITGYDDIHFLRNLFRRYSDGQARGERIVMVWRNVKDGDYWIVEPRDFRLTQDASSPLTYKYQINLQGLSPFDPSLANWTVPEDPLARIRSFQRFVSRIQEFKQNLTASFLVIATQINRISGAGYFAINTTLGTLTSVIRGLDAIVAAQGQVKDNFIRNVRRADAEFKTAAEILNDRLQPVSPNATVRTVDTRDPVVNAFLKSRWVFSKLLVEPRLRNSVSTENENIRGRIRSSYRKPGVGVGATREPATGDSPSFIGNSSSPSSVAEGRVREGETIRDLAKRLLGDSRRWHELVVINDLRAPFTADADAGEGVLSPGDAILYPSITSGIDGLTISNPKNSPDEQEGDLDNTDSLVSQTYGRDLRLRSIQASGDIDLTDIAVNQKGDFATISGVPNVQQAIRVRFLTEQGELSTHPNFGAAFPIGKKADSFSFNTFRINTLATLRSDPRIQDVVDLNFNAVGDTLYVDGRLQLIDAQEYVATNFALRRF